LGWAKWIRELWEEFTGALGPRAEGLGEPWVPPGMARSGVKKLEEATSGASVARTGSIAAGSFRRAPHVDLRSLRRWARMAKRSRWPLLRSVVAESLRAAFEPVRLDRAPLPTDRAVLLELYCLVRVLGHLTAPGSALRWLDACDGSNTVDARGLRYEFQLSLDRGHALDTAPFAGGLRATVRDGGCRVPHIVDGYLALAEPRGGFDGVLIEAKSGAQAPHDAYLQLEVYRAVLKAEGAGRLLVLGVIEGLEPQVIAPETERPDDDLWVFCAPEALGRVLERWLGPRADGIRCRTLLR
jgi:hypothetical protein